MPPKTKAKKASSPNDCNAVQALPPSATLDAAAVVEIVVAQLAVFKLEQDASVEARLAELIATNSKLECQLAEVMKENEFLKKQLSPSQATKARENRRPSPGVHGRDTSLHQASGNNQEPPVSWADKLKPNASSEQSGLSSSSHQQAAGTGTGNGKWETQGAKSRARKRAIHGTSSTIGPNSLVAVPTGYPVEVFISRLHPDTTTKEVEEGVLAKAGVAVKVTPRPSKMPHLYSSFLLGCISTDLKALLHPSVWTKGLVVKRWYNHQKPAAASSTDAPSAHDPSSSTLTDRPNNPIDTPSSAQDPELSQETLEAMGEPFDNSLNTSRGSEELTDAGRTTPNN